MGKAGKIRSIGAVVVIIIVTINSKKMQCNDGLKKKRRMQTAPRIMRTILPMSASNIVVRFWSSKEVFMKNGISVDVRKCTCV